MTVIPFAGRFPEGGHHFVCAGCGSTILSALPPIDAKCAGCTWNEMVRSTYPITPPGPHDQSEPFAPKPENR